MLPRPEHPRPDLYRKDWLNLNGYWDFRFDFGKSGFEEGAPKGLGFDKKIIVPFAPESALSGITYTGFMPSVWYKRTIKIPEKYQDKRVILHFGAVDYNASVYLNSHLVGEHRGGYTPFQIDITDYLLEGENLLIVGVYDENRSGLQPRGKQAQALYSSGCDYTRTTGIWQTVWLEFVSQNYIEDLQLIPDWHNCQVIIFGFVKKNTKSQNGKITVEITYGNKIVGEGSQLTNWGRFFLPISLNKKVSWGIGQGNLYNIKLYYEDDSGSKDFLQTYFGLRAIEIDGNKILLNGRPIFQRLVLDQGYYPDGVYTAREDILLKNDIEIAQLLGFDGARLHQKVFEPRYLYYADKLGYVTWAEFGSWGLKLNQGEAWKNIIPQWCEVVKRDRNHPSIITWCPLNETERDHDKELLKALYQISHDLDGTRPVIDTSGYIHVKTDIYDTHDYIQEPNDFRERYIQKNLPVVFPDLEKYAKQPYIVSEYGGIWWNKEKQDNDWGYGERPQSEEEFLERFRGLTQTLLNSSKVSGFCYTQLYDVEQETNGLLSYNRKPKFSLEKINSIVTQKAAIEK